jgi:hypothetical protein
MFMMLLANAEGRAYLTDSKLLKEIAFNLEELDPVSPLFSKSHCSVETNTPSPFSQRRLWKIL